MEVSRRSSTNISFFTNISFYSFTPLKTQKPSEWNDFLLHARIPAAYYSTFCEDVATLGRYVPISDSKLSSCSLVCVIRRTSDSVFI